MKGCVTMATDKKEPNRHRRQVMNFRVTVGEREQIVVNMTKSGMSDLSKYMRMMLINGEVNVISNFEIAAINKLLVELGRIGNNVNQIARIANSTSKVFKAELVELNELQKSIDSHLREMLKHHQV